MGMVNIELVSSGKQCRPTYSEHVVVMIYRLYVGHLQLLIWNVYRPTINIYWLVHLCFHARSTIIESIIMWLNVLGSYTRIS